jgi:hypothetical protein
MRGPTKVSATVIPMDLRSSRCPGTASSTLLSSWPEPAVQIGYARVLALIARVTTLRHDIT